MNLPHNSGQINYRAEASNASEGGYIRSLDGFFEFEMISDFHFAQFTGHGE